MQSHMAILIAYCIDMKKPSNIVEFCNSCWKTAKNAPFHIKLSLIHISEPTRQAEISYAVFCLKKNVKGAPVPDEGYASKI